MQRRLVLLVPAEKGGEIDAALAQLFSLDATIVSDDEVEEAQLPSEMRLIDLSPYEHDKDRASTSGLVTIADAMALTAYEAWRRLGGREERGGYLHRRATGNLFTALCRMMARMNWQFTDLDPASFVQFTLEDWVALGVTGRPAGILASVEVCDVRIFVQLTDEDIRGFFFKAATQSAIIIAARDRLKAQIASE